MNQPNYYIARWPYGWTLNSPPHQSGIPILAFQEVMPLFQKGDVIDSGISHHLRTSGHPDVVETIVSPSNGKLWKEEIEGTLNLTDPEERWWRGTDTGTSSATIFSTFAQSKWKAAAERMGRGGYPHDVSDLGRCLRLLAIFPEWEDNLHLVAEKYPETPWPKLIAQWGKLKSANPEEQSNLLKEILKRD